MRYTIYLYLVIIALLFSIENASAGRTYNAGSDTSLPGCMVKLGETSCWTPTYGMSEPQNIPGSPYRHQAPYQLRYPDTDRIQNQNTGRSAVIPRTCEAGTVWSKIEHGSKYGQRDMDGQLPVAFEGCLKPFPEVAPGAPNTKTYKDYVYMYPDLAEIEGFCPLGESWQKKPRQSTMKSSDPDTYACLPNYTSVLPDEVKLTINTGECYEYGSTAQADLAGTCYQPCFEKNIDGTFECFAKYSFQAPSGRTLSLINFTSIEDFVPTENNTSSHYGARHIPIAYGSTSYISSDSATSGGAPLTLKFGVTNKIAIYLGDTYIKTEEFYLPCPKGKEFFLTSWDMSSGYSGRCMQLGVAIVSGGLPFSYDSFEVDLKKGLESMKNFTEVLINGKSITLPTTFTIGEYRCYGCFAFNGISMQKEFNGIPTPAVFTYIKGKGLDISGKIKTSILPALATGKRGTIIGKEYEDGDYVVRMKSYIGGQYYIDMPIRADGTWSSQDTKTSLIHQDKLFADGYNSFSLNILPANTPNTGVDAGRGSLGAVPFIANVTVSTGSKLLPPELIITRNYTRLLPGQSGSTNWITKNVDANSTLTMTCSNGNKSSLPLTRSGNISTYDELVAGGWVGKLDCTWTLKGPGGTTVVKDSVEIVPRNQVSNTGSTTTPISASSLDAASKARIDKIIARVEKRVSAMIVENALKYLDSSIARIKALPNKNAKAKLIDAYTIEKLEDLRDTIAETETDYIGLIDTSLDGN